MEDDAAADVAGPSGLHSECPSAHSLFSISSPCCRPMPSKGMHGVM